MVMSMPTGARKAGEFCWFDVMTKDVTKTKALFAKLFGWTYSDMPMPDGAKYTMALCGGTQVGGLTDLNTNNPMAKGVPPHMGLHVMTKSADETAKAVAANGGKILAGPFDVMDAGRMVSFTDPKGAALNAWEPKKHPGMNIDATKHGAPSWIELVTSDVDGAGHFYAKVFGWQPGAKMGKEAYIEFSHGGKSVAGMMALTKDMGPMPPHWGCYMAVDNIDQTVKDCAANGGKVLMQPHNVPEVGKFAVMQTSDGVVFSAITYKKA